MQLQTSILAKSGVDNAGVMMLLSLICVSVSILRSLLSGQNILMETEGFSIILGGDGRNFFLEMENEYNISPENLKNGRGCCT